MRRHQIAGALLVVMLVSACGSGVPPSPMGPTGAEEPTTVTSGAPTEPLVPLESDADQAVTITSVEPSIGPTGGDTVVTIAGTGFATGAEVSFGVNAGLAVSVDSPTTITVLSPAGSVGVVEVNVTLPDGSLATAPDAFVYVTRAAAPDVTDARVVDGVIVLNVAKPHVSEAVEYYQVSVDGGEWRSLDASEWPPTQGEDGLIVMLRDPTLEPGQTALVRLRAVSVAGFGAESRVVSVEADVAFNNTP